MIIISVIAITVGMFFSRKLGQLLTQPINELKAAALKISEGNFDVDMEYDSLGELGDLAGAFRETSKGLEDVINGIDVLAKSVKESSENFRTNANTLKEVLQGIEQISGVAQSNSAVAEQSSAVSEELSAQSISLDQIISRYNLLDV